MTTTSAIVLAAGQGTRMKSSTPKMLHRACGRPLLFYPVWAALAFGAVRVCLVVSEGTREAIERELSRWFSSEHLLFAVQRDQPGTGGAALAGMAALGGAVQDVLVLNGDLPLIRGEDLSPLREARTSGAALAFLTFEPKEPTGYGRVLRDEQGRVTEIREERDLRSEGERAVREVNAGTYLSDGSLLERALAGLEPENAQGEYYLTDIVRAISSELPVAAVRASAQAAQGVNDRTQLRAAERALSERIRTEHEARGVTFGQNVSVDFGVELGPDVQLEEGVRLRGGVRVGAGTLVDVGCVIEDSTIGEETELKPYCVIQSSRVGDGCSIGPFAHLRPGSEIEDNAKVGNFVETKNTRLGEGAKVNHLAYVGDAEIGEGANLGAGVIVCNYDGFMKRTTRVGRRVFVGSDSQLIAPVSIGDDAYVATGTTVACDVPEGALAIGRVRQENKLDYAGPLRERLREQARVEKLARDSEPSEPQK